VKFFGRSAGSSQENRLGYPVLAIARTMVKSSPSGWKPTSPLRGIRVIGDDLDPIAGLGSTAVVIGVEKHEQGAR